MNLEDFPKKILNDYVLVDPDPLEEKTAGGIIIPDTAKEKPITGTVVMVGPGKPQQPIVLVPGQKISFSKFWGNKTLEIKEKTYFLMSIADVISVFN